MNDYIYSLIKDFDLGNPPPDNLAKVDEALKVAEGFLSGGPVVLGKALKHVFSQITVKNATTAKEEKSSEEAWVQPTILKVGNEGFPQEAEPEAHEFTKLNEALKAQIKSLLARGQPDDILTENILTLLKAYTWCQAAPTINEKAYNGNLYEYLKLRAALTHCLVANPNTFLFACLDLSGVQKFLYDISSKKAAASLKGRSFYLQLLIDAIVEKLFCDLKLSSAHIVYSSGGKCFLLLPDTVEVTQIFNALREIVQKQLFKDHGLSLYICMDFVPFAPIDTDISALWRKVTEKVAEQKSHKLQDYATTPDGFDALFTPQNGGGVDNVCGVTGKVGKVKKLDDGTYVSDTVNEQIKLGSSLKQGSVINVYRDKLPENQNGEFSIAPLGLGIVFVIGDRSEQAYKTIYLNDPEKALSSNGSGISTFRFYGGNEQPIDIRTKLPKTFDKLASISNKGSNKLGVLRMDVDGLGDVFIKGLGDNKTLSAYATLSFSLDWFFSGYLNYIRADRSKEFAGYKDSINILYSGGDDLFVVGHWDAAIRFAYDVRQQFEYYTKHPLLSISGGIAMVGASYPIAKAAELAGEAEEAGKGYNRLDTLSYKEIYERKAGVEKPTKNALGLFGEAIGWEQFDKVDLLTGNLKNWLADNDNVKASLQQAILFRSMGYYLDAKSNLDTKEARPNLRYVWTSMYQLTRYQGSLPKNADPAAVDYVNTLKEVILTKPVSDLKVIAVASRWAELKTKS